MITTCAPGGGWAIALKRGTHSVLHSLGSLDGTNTLQPSRHHDNRHSAGEDLRDCGKQRNRVRMWSIWILKRHQDFRTRPRGRIAAEEERATPRPHVTIRVVHTHLTLFSRSSEAAGGAQVILESSPLAV